MNCNLDPFYPIFESADTIEKLVPLGIRLVQLRMKDKTPATLRDHIRTAKAICLQYQCRLVINDYWQLAIEETCDFIHLGQEDLEKANLAEIRQAGLKLGISTHDETELNRALSTDPDYVALGPIYPTMLKKMKWAPQTLTRIGLWKKKIGDLPLVVIGGLNVDHVSDVFTHHCNSAAVISDIVTHANPAERVKQWIHATQQWRSNP
ncbi:MAG: thiamine-phosphate pyrophosphorylase [Candidatus Tokpelaia sp. JSC085]|nr:MAG: thiamine-phosphate pyrophosphorylase [Candidatus Tokpelaia sp. JSC085]